MTDFSARPSLHEEGYVGDRHHEVHMSNWRASPTTFGPIGRMVVTVGMVLFLLTGLFMTGGFSPFGLWFLFGWTITAGFVLRQTWQPVRVDDPTSGLRGRLAQRFPHRGSPLPLRAIGVVSVGSATVVAGYIWMTGDSMARFGIVVVAVLVGITVMLLRLSDP